LVEIVINNLIHLSYQIYQTIEIGSGKKEKIHLFPHNGRKTKAKEEMDMKQQSGKEREKRDTLLLTGKPN